VTAESSAASGRAAAQVGGGREPRPIPMPLAAGGWLLCLLGAAKVAVMLARPAALSGMDPVLHLSYRIVVPVMAAIEMAAGILVAWGLRPARGALLLSGMAAGFLGYRVAHALWFSERSCACLAGLGKAIPFLSEAQEQGALLAMALWLLLIGAWSGMLELGRQ